MTSLSDNTQADIIEAFNSTSRYIDEYIDDLLNIDNSQSEGMVNQIYPPGLHLNKANTSDTEAIVRIYIYLDVPLEMADFQYFMYCQKFIKIGFSTSCWSPW